MIILRSLIKWNILDILLQSKQGDDYDDDTYRQSRKMYAQANMLSSLVCI